MVVAQLEAPLARLMPSPFDGSEMGCHGLALVPRTPATGNDRVRDDTAIWTVAHELRQPLSVIATAVAIVERESASAATGQAVAVMARQLRHMSRMVDDLLDAARLSTGKVSLISQRIDVRDVMAEAGADCAPAAAERRQLLDVARGVTPLWVSADRQRLYQVFSNLLRNAIKFTPHGGRITFTGGSHDSTITVRVCDTGRGIDRRALPGIFDLFAQVQPSGLGGVGIGLNVAREIVSLHRGQIAARSDGLGKGSEFVVTLPLSPPSVSS